MLFRPACFGSLDWSGRCISQAGPAGNILRGRPGENLGGQEMDGATSQLHADVSNTVTEGMIAERRLWTAVLVNAVEEWRRGNLRERREAQQFLFEDNDDFATVCAGAGLNPESMRTQLLKIGRKIQPDPWHIKRMAA